MRFRAQLQTGKALGNISVVGGVWVGAPKSNCEYRYGKRRWGRSCFWLDRVYSRVGLISGILCRILNSPGAFGRHDAAIS